MGMPCIYTKPGGLCNGTARLSSREHYLSAGLGEFRGDSRLVDKICDDCQARLGQLEDVFLHASPEAFFRQMLGIKGRRGHRTKAIYYEPTFSIPPVAVLGIPSGSDRPILWEPVNRDQCAPMKQIIFTDKDGHTYPLAFRSGAFTALSIRDLLDRNGIGELARIEYIATTEDEEREMETLGAGLLPHSQTVDQAMPADGAHIEAEMRALISSEYKRAIAKIAFHFLLHECPVYSGLEDEFDAVKAFIHAGQGDGDRFVQAIREPFLQALKQGGQLKRWGHLLTCECDADGIEARLQFFAGPGVDNLIWRVLIGRNPCRVIFKQVVGKAYLYLDEPVDEGYDGEVIELIAARTP